ncbi:MAG: hypothetical protein VB127_03895 [Sphaerochaeta sp.]|jgi:hypothetical protein|nr:hypothetical protein [Sphaerochaeta sp.]
MGKNLRFVLLGVQALVTLILSAVIVHSIIASVQNGMWVTTRSHLLPSLIHLWVALIAALLLCFFYRANIGAEARVLPLLFLMISLGNVKILPLHHALTGLFLLNPLNVSVLYHFSLLFGSFLFLSSGLFQQTINPTKLGQYSFVGAASALLLSILVPVSASSASFLWEVSVTNRLFLGVCILINALAVLTFLIAIFEEHFSRQTLARCLSFILMIIGTMMVTVSQDTLFNSLGLVFYVAGTTTLILVTRTYHIWT